MVKKSKTLRLYVYMNDKLVGYLTRLSTSQMVFEYDEQWLSWQYARPISLSMPLTETAYQGDLVYAFFDNLLPDSNAIRRRIQTRFHSTSTECFDLLSDIGVDCVGAIQLLSQPLESSTRIIKANAMSESDIAKMLKAYRVAPLGMRQDTDFRISIAGAQEKTALLWYHNQWHLPESTTPTTHILKLPIGNIEHAGIDLSESVANEWLCLKLLSAFGLPVNNAEILRFEDVQVLVVERFDRKWQDEQTWLLRIPQEDMCQALGYPADLKYESDGGPGMEAIMRLLLFADDAYQARRQFMKSTFLFWLLAAIDGHAKNFSITLEANGRYKLTPLYDVMSAYPIIEKKQLQAKKIKMAMGLKANNRHYHWHNIQIRQWLAMAEHCNFSENDMKSIIDEIFDQLDSVIDNVASDLSSLVPEQITNSLFAGLKAMKAKTQTPLV